MSSQIHQQLHPFPIREVVGEHPGPVHHPPEEDPQANNPTARTSKFLHSFLKAAAIKLEGAAAAASLANQEELDSFLHSSHLVKRSWWGEDEEEGEQKKERTYLLDVHCVASSDRMPDYSAEWYLYLFLPICLNLAYIFMNRVFRDLSQRGFIVSKELNQEKLHVEYFEPTLQGKLFLFVKFCVLWDLKLSHFKTNWLNEYFLYFVQLIL